MVECRGRERWYKDEAEKIWYWPQEICKWICLEMGNGSLKKQPLRFGWPMFCGGLIFKSRQTGASTVDK
jgi:hypothetical protein